MLNLNANSKNIKKITLQNATWHSLHKFFQIFKEKLQQLLFVKYSKIIKPLSISPQVLLQLFYSLITIIAFIICLNDQTTFHLSSGTT